MGEPAAPAIVSFGDLQQSSMNVETVSPRDFRPGGFVNQRGGQPFRLRTGLAELRELGDTRYLRNTQLRTC